MADPVRVFRSSVVVARDATGPRAIHTSGGIITRVAAFDDVPAGAEVVDVGELPILPGLVDTHVHVNEPGRTEWEGFHTATRAAAAGGVTTLIDMPLNAIPATTTLEALEAKRADANGQAHVNVGFWGGVVPGNADQLEPLWRAGVSGFKAFMCASGVDEFPAVTLTDLRAAMTVLAPLDAPLLVHAEAPEVLADSGLPDGDPTSYATWLHSRPAAAEQIAIEQLAALAADTGARVHVVHVSSPQGARAVSEARHRGARLTAETCPHYLHFAAAEVPDGRTEYKCAPPIRGRREREGLWEELRGGGLSMVVSDHSPSPPLLKGTDGNFLAAWGGIASLQLGLPVVWTRAPGRGFELGDVVRWMCENPARLAGLADRGAIAPGCAADLVVFDPELEWAVAPARLEHRHKLTPYAGAYLTGRVVATFVGGVCVFRDGEMLGRPRGVLLSRQS